jgi:N-methylhydantoinase B
VTATIVETNPTSFEEVAVDPITIDLVEQGFENAMHRMNALIFRVSMSPLMREQRDSFRFSPTVTAPDGRSVRLAGQELPGQLRRHGRGR